MFGINRIKSQIRELYSEIRDLKKEITLIKNPYLYEIGDVLFIDIKYHTTSIYGNQTYEIHVEKAIIVNKDYSYDLGIFYDFVHKKTMRKFRIYQSNLTKKYGNVYKILD